MKMLGSVHAADAEAAAPVLLGRIELGFRSYPDGRLRR
jgi:hypothetical protein